MSLDPYSLITIPVLLLIITLLVAAHELGHYLFAKFFGMEVEEFSIGFGKKPIWTWMKRGDTVFTIRPWPLGGFVRIKGMVPQEDGSETELENGFYSKSPAKRLAVLFAGPLFSVLAGMFLLVGLLSFVGKPEVTDAVFGDVIAGDPAAQAGFRSGDRVLTLDGKPAGTWNAMHQYIGSHVGKRLFFVVQRDGTNVNLSVTPVASKQQEPLLDDSGKPTGEMGFPGKIGVKGIVRYRSEPILTAISESSMAPVAMVEGIASVFVHPKDFGSTMGGPASIAAATRNAVEDGFFEVVYLAAVLSISLGILNLLPFPPMDGGQMAVAFAELFRRGKRLSIEIQNTVNAIGFALISMLIIAVLWVDFKRLILPDKPKPALATQVQAPVQASKPLPSSPSVKKP